MSRAADRGTICESRMTKSGKGCKRKRSAFVISPNSFHSRREIFVMKRCEHLWSNYPTILAGIVTATIERRYRMTLHSHSSWRVETERWRFAWEWRVDVRETFFPDFPVSGALSGSRGWSLWRGSDWNNPQLFIIRSFIHILRWVFVKLSKSWDSLRGESHRKGKVDVIQSALSLSLAFEKKRRFVRTEGAKWNEKRSGCLLPHFVTFALVLFFSSLLKDEFEFCGTFLRYVSTKLVFVRREKERMMWGRKNLADKVSSSFLFPFILR